MRITEERVARLTGLGLSATQARAYLALLDLGPASVGDVAKAASMPRTKLYGVFEDLHRNGLVDVQAGQPVRYRPRSIEAYLGRLQHDLDLRSRELREKTPELLDEFDVGDAQGAGPTSVFRGRANALLHLHQALGRAESSLALTCTAGTLARFHAAQLDDRLAELVSEGVGVELSVQRDVRLGARLPAEGTGLVVRRMEAWSPMEVLLVDKRHTVAWVPDPDDDSSHRGRDEGIVSQSGAIHTLFGAAMVGVAELHRLVVGR